MAATAPPHPSVDDATRLLHGLTGPLDADTTAALAGHLERVSLPPGAVLLRRGDPGDVFVVSGRPRFFTVGDDGRELATVMGRVPEGPL